MPEPEFTAENLNKYVNELSIDALKKLVDELHEDFDAAFSRRFEVSRNQASTLNQTPTFFKQSLTSAFEDLFRIRSEAAEAEFKSAGLDYGSGTGKSMELSDIDIEVGHRKGCTWYVKITIRK